MKRKYEEDGCSGGKRMRENGQFSVLTKRKNQFHEPEAKRYHAYSVMEEKDRYISKLETIIKSMMNKVEELEYQLEMTRCMTDNTIHNNNLIQSY